MNAAELLQVLQADGLHFKAVDGQWLDVWPSRRLTPERLDVIKQHKPELIELLAANDMKPGAYRLVLKNGVSMTITNCISESEVIHIAKQKCWEVESVTRISK